MRAPCIFTVVVAGGATLLATQFSCTNTGGKVSQTTVLTITGATLSNPAGTFSMPCPLTYFSPQYPHTEERTCTSGSLSAQSTDGTTTIGELSHREFSRCKKPFIAA